MVPQWMMGQNQVKIKLALLARNSTSCRRDGSCRCQLRVQEGLGKHQLTSWRIYGKLGCAESDLSR